MNRSDAILLVDDSESDIFLVRTAFKKAQFPAHLTEVRDGAEAIAYLTGKDPYCDRKIYPLPTVMLLDLNMPMKSGFDVLEWLRAQAGLRRLTVIILTSSLRTEDVERAFDLGANSFLVKPSSIEELTAMIRSLQDWLRYNHFPPLYEAVQR